MKEHEVNYRNNFIMGWYPEDTSFCDELLHYYQREQTIKGSGTMGGGKVMSNIKDSIDATLHPEMLSEFKYRKILKKCSDLYNEKYPYSACVGYSVKQGFNIQYYPINGGYKTWHSERNSADNPDVSRHLVWMTYLNDVNDGGTEFYYQGLTIKAEKGLTLIWPADWTFTHKGQISNTKEKYIITGWFNLLKEHELEKMRNKEYTNENSTVL